MSKGCRYPLGTQDGETIFCGRTAAHMAEGFRFCESHVMMVVRGGLDFEYTDGTTPRELIRDEVYGFEKR